LELFRPLRLNAMPDHFDYLAVLHQEANSLQLTDVRDRITGNSDQIGTLVGRPWLVRFIVRRLPQQRDTGPDVGADRPNHVFELVTGDPWSCARSSAEHPA